jgi:hypothetical protein
MSNSLGSKMVRAFILIFAWIGSASLAVMVADRRPPTSYEGGQALSDRVEQGGTARVEFEVYRSRICPVVVRRYMVDSASVRHAITNYTVGRTTNPGHEIYSRTFTVPDTAALGPAYYEVQLEYRCNIVQQLWWPIEITSPPIPLTIIPKKENTE